MRLSGESSRGRFGVRVPSAPRKGSLSLGYFSRVSRCRRDSVPTLRMRFVYAEALTGQLVDRDENRFISSAGSLLCSIGPAVSDGIGARCGALFICIALSEEHQASKLRPLPCFDDLE